MNKPKNFLMRFVPDCEEAIEVQWRKLHETTGLRRRMGARIHLMVCKSCRSYQRDLDWLRTTLNLSSASEPLTASYKMREEIRGRMQEKLAAFDATDEPRSKSDSDRLTGASS